MNKMTRRQKNILNSLLDCYESSLSYRGENKITQRYRVNISKVWPGYSDDYTDVSEIDEFEREVEELVASGLVSAVRTKTNELKNIVAVEDRIADYYRILDRREKKITESEEKHMYETYCGRNDVLGKFCREQLELLNSNHSAKYTKERAVNYIALLERILGNTEELYERELSVQVLKDSKLLEKSYRRTVCDILREYGDYERFIEEEHDDRTIQMIILEQHNIYPNPDYIYVKGNAEVRYVDGSTMRIREGLPIGLSSSLIDSVESIRVFGDRIITIENLTTFHRFNENGFFCVYLAGYHSHRKTQFLKQITEPENKKWFHFGDIDPDGFMILSNLRKKTRLEFEPYHMEAGLLERYMEFTKKLEESDIVKANNMIDNGIYVDMLKEMLTNGRKLEQEALFM